MPEELAGDRHRVGGELAAAGAGARARLVFDRAEVGVAHRAGGVRADRLEHFLNGDRLVVEVAGRDRSAVEQHAGNVEARERHHAAGNRLVAADQDDEAVEAVAARDQLDRVGDHLAADQRRAHALGAHRDAVGDRDGVELHRRAAGGADAGLHVHREIAQVVVARADLDPGVGDADERLLEVGVGEADRLQHRARRRAARAGRERIAAIGHDTTSNGSVCDALRGVFQLA